MKLATTVLALIMLTLALLPCSDAYQLSNATQEQSLKTHEHTHQHSTESHNEADGCTPFCVCLCCGITSLIVQHYPIFAKATPLLYRKENKQPYTFNYSFNYGVAIWHPPQFS